MKLFPPGETYTRLGFLTEYLLRIPSDSINETAIKELCKRHSDLLIPDKTLKLKSTQDYLSKVRITRSQLETVPNKPADFQFDIAISGENFIGHPDIKTDTDIYEVKTTGRLKQSWSDFIYQVFAYAALVPTCTHIHLVLPLQQKVWSFDLAAWTPAQRGAYKNVLERSASPAPAKTTTEKSTKPQPTPQDLYDQMLVLQELPIGFHAHKLPTLTSTVNQLIENDKYIPYQIFLGSPTSFALKDPPAADVEAAAKLIKNANLQLFIHAPYVINLSDREATNTYMPVLMKNLQIGEALGAKGVVVHVGKSVKQNPEIARNTMKLAIHEILMKLPVDCKCPLLLETPAGQGTELLTKYEEFRDFALEIMSEGGYGASFGVCIDTCHVFATGYDPAKYVRDALKDRAFSDLLKLIHFNDSKDLCGSCVDRHAPLYRGHIPVASLNEVASLADMSGIPLVRE